jgi:hypothetical protein
LTLRFVECLKRLGIPPRKSFNPSHSIHRQPLCETGGGANWAPIGIPAPRGGRTGISTQQTITGGASVLAGKIR